MELNLIYSKSEITIAKDVVFYDGYDTIGDIGGYMGLLLGASLLSIYDSVSELLKSIFKKKRKEGQLSSECEEEVRARERKMSRQVMVAPSPKGSVSSVTG